MDTFLTKGIDVSETAVEGASHVFNKATNILSDTFKDQATDLLKFLFERDIIKTAIGIILGTQITSINKQIVEGIITPIFDKITLKSGESFKIMTYEVVGIKFKIGLIIQELIKLFITILLVYLLWKGLHFKNFEIVQKLGTK